MATHASHACAPCARLKRQCTRELPECLLCVELTESCSYSAQAPDPSAQQSPLRDLSLLGRRNSVTNSPQTLEIERPVPPWVLKHLLAEDAEHEPKIDEAFAAILGWLPIINLKKLQQEVTSADIRARSSLALLQLSLRLMTEKPALDEPPAIKPVYLATKRFISATGSYGTTSLQILQAIVLTAVFEIGHGIFPAANFTVAHAARAGMLTGLHESKNTTRLPKEPESSVLEEEKRRVWWAVLILDRIMHIATSGVPLNTTDPSQEALLPCSDRLWIKGDIGASKSLLNTSFLSDQSLGPFASCCQTANLLGRIIHHRDTDSSTLDRDSRLTEALRLHKTLVDLDADLTQRFLFTYSLSWDTTYASVLVAYALCCTTRFILYKIYTPKEQDASSISQSSTAQTTEIQKASQTGTKDLAINGVVALVRRIKDYTTLDSHSASPLICYCVYHAASACILLVNGSQAAQSLESLRLYVGALKEMSKRWRAAELYLKLLDHEGGNAVLGFSTG